MKMTREEIENCSLETDEIHEDIAIARDEMNTLEEHKDKPETGHIERYVLQEHIRKRERYLEKLQVILDYRTAYGREAKENIVKNATGE